MELLLEERMCLMSFEPFFSLFLFGHLPFFFPPSPPFQMKLIWLLKGVDV